MRLIFALTALVALTAATPARDWSKTTTRTATGAYLTGNSAARVKVIEYSSFTCPHCGHFAVQSAPILKAQMIARGSTSLEVRNLVRDRLDLAAAIVARCGDVNRYPVRSLAIFTAQDQWLARGAAFEQANQERIALYPMLAQLRAYADGAGLTAIGTANGLTPKAIDACFVDQAAVDALVDASSSIPPEVTGTPTFYINGRVTPAHDWATLQPLLRTAGAR
ncbi:hypothetical protein ASE75_09030 [Sphingomonas sp. Leaf17]|uniref:thioredoxin domain-containing protein n=1 Tax=Sphingomonas sp. Leaf17 TaxID=1735683 RepID=UPI0006F85ECC|nr:thioredoxin domain-containing protein [Sphingomonas sp. Leaf17]KQM64145.1 hypothetical protein ASE75_09030 [Sphingomonas sp. Leaf17]